MIVVLTAGHSNTDPGAVAGGQTEAKLMADLRNLAAQRLRKLGHTVWTDGEGADNQPLTDALALVRSKRPHLALELHMNAAANPAATGVETIALPKDRKLAQALSARVAAVLGLRLRGSDGWIDQSMSARGRLGFINAGGLILECAFISNPGDLRAVRTHMIELAEAIAQAIDAGGKA